MLLQVDHPNCIRLFDVYITPRKVYLVTELVTGGELLDRWAWHGMAVSLPDGPACASRVAELATPCVHACSG